MQDYQCANDRTAASCDANELRRNSWNDCPQHILTTDVTRKMDQLEQNSTSLQHRATPSNLENDALHRSVEPTGPTLH